MEIFAFLSYSDKDRIIAKKLAVELKKFDFNIFLAHEGIVTGTVWEDKLKNEIYNRELFLVLLSENFKTAPFTNHEVGIATAHNKRIFSIRVDNIDPYGFMTKFHAAQINSEINSDEITILASELTTFTKEGQKLIDEAIEDLVTANQFAAANAAASRLSAYPSFTPEQLDKIAKAYLENYEVRGSWTAGPFASDLFLKMWNLLGFEFKDKLRVQLNLDK